MEDKPKEKLSWWGGGIAIGLTALVDLVMVVIDITLGWIFGLGILINWGIIFVFLLSFSLWMGIKGIMSLQRGLALWQLIVSGLVPFAMTTTVSIMMGRIIAAEKLGNLSPALAKAVK